LVTAVHHPKRSPRKISNMMAEKEQVQVESRAELRQWLAKNHERKEGVWLITFKKSAGDKYVSWDDLVQEVICFGWIDGQARKLDADRSMQWIAPRKRGSGWSRRNKGACGPAGGGWPADARWNCEN
jgi:uncharacterized protein YdeI (YjbR/CyaY-like superfamily)